MALPKLNDVPEYTIKIPSSGKMVKFRPFLVKEQKVLLLALESQNRDDILRAIMNTIAACSSEPLDFNSLSTFDVDYLFIAIRSKSVGEKIKPLMRCPECSETTQIEFKLDDIKIETKELVNKIQLTDDISLKLKYPSYDTMLKMGIGEDTKPIDILHYTILSAIEAVVTTEEIFLFADETLEEQKRFLESLSTSQFEKITEFVSELPILKHDIDWKCQSCGADNSNILQGYEDFF